MATTKKATKPTKKAPALAAPAVKAPAEQPVVIAYKGFDKDMKCRDFQYEIGKTYEHEGRVEACKSGFHACEYPLHVFRYYQPGTSKFAVVEQSGNLIKHGEDTKVASSRITIKAQIDIAGIVKAAIKYTMDRCTPAEGGASDAPNVAVKADGSNKSATASGYYGAATASGKKSTAFAPGRNGKARGKEGCAIFLVFRDADWRIVHAKAAIVGRDGIKLDTFYKLNEAGEFVEVSA